MDARYISITMYGTWYNNKYFIGHRRNMFINRSNRVAPQTEIGLKEEVNRSW